MHVGVDALLFGAVLRGVVAEDKIRDSTSGYRPNQQGVVTNEVDICAVLRKR